MSREYTVSFENVTVSAAQDLWEVNPAADKPIELLAVTLWQSSDKGDAEEEMLRVTIKRTTASFASGSGGSSGTSVKVNPDDAASGAAAETNNTSVSTGTQEILEPFYPNIRAGEQMIFMPESRYVFKNGKPLIVKLEAAPTDALSMCGCLKYREI